MGDETESRYFESHHIFPTMRSRTWSGGLQLSRRRLDDRRNDPGHGCCKRGHVRETLAGLLIEDTRGAERERERVESFRRNGEACRWEVQEPASNVEPAAAIIGAAQSRRVPSIKDVTGNPKYGEALWMCALRCVCLRIHTRCRRRF